MLAAREILDTCVELGGTLSGEHGIGIEKLDAMIKLFSPADIKAMEYVRRAFDPFDLCNPGKVLPTPRACGESGRRPLLRHRIAMQ